MSERKSIPHRFVFLDRDGVINVDIGDYTTTIEEWKWAAGALEGIRMLTEAGFGIIVITNQACIAKGLQTEYGLAVLHDFMLNHIHRAGGDILRIYHCPHQTSDGCSCRKPEPGMLLTAIKDYSIIPAKTFFIGDAPRDIEAGKRAGTRTILINTDETAVSPDTGIQADFYAGNLLDAARIVIRETQLI